MCGIAGIVTAGRQVEKGLLQIMCEAIGHRGPDHFGIYTDHRSGLSVGLGAQRLSIIDLSEAGHQPMSNETGDIWITYNGEIYNHQELRRELEAKGHIYRSRTDTETVIHAYEEYGLECLSRFNGMFAFALYDSPRQRVILARDRMGIKPLYYLWDGDTLLFASELKALLADSRTPRAVNPVAMSLYLSLGYVPSPHCMCAGILKLLPGSYLILQNGAVSLQTYWTPQLNASRIDSRRASELIVETRSVLEHAVQRQLMSDVPVGVFLSGGVDSTIITALAQRFHEGPLDTFSVGFADSQGKVEDDSLYNQDLLYARQVAHELGTRHHEITLREGPGLAELLRKAISYLDEPLWESSFVSLHLMAQLARQNGVIVVLTGDGGDELFAGYPWYLGARRLEMYEKIPFLKCALPLLSALGGERALGAKARDLQRKFGQSHLTKYRLSYEIFSAEEKRALIRPDVLDELDADPVDTLLNSVLEQSHGDALPEKLALADLTLWVREHFNHRVDRMSMLNSVEARVPFQDNEVVDFALGIPLRRKMRRSEGKYLLRQAFRDLLPEAVLRRPKRPFATPAWSWLRGPLRKFAIETLSQKQLRKFGFLEPEVACSVVQDFMKGNDAFAFRVWVLLTFQLWCEAYLVK